MSSGTMHKFGKLETTLVAAVGVAFCMQLYLAFAQEINWDEFFYLSKVYDYQAGTLSKALQSFAVHFFSWLPLVGGNEIVQIEAARLIMLALELGTAICIYVIGCRFASRTASLLAALAFVTAGATLVHGASFRADPIATFLMMVSLALLTRSTLKTAHLAIAAISIALALMVTIKSSLYAPALLAAGLWQASRSTKPKAMIVKFAGVAAGAIAAFGIFYFWHQSTLVSAGTAASQDMVASAAQATLLDFKLFPRWVDVLIELPRSLIPAILLIYGGYFLISSLAKGQGDHKKTMTVLGLASPILCLLIYRNAYPYFFPFIFAPAMVLAAHAIDRLQLDRLALGLVAFLMLGSAGWTMWQAADRDQQAQTETIDAVHHIFPEPVYYIDRNSMIASFPKRGLFMSRWGLTDYQKAGKPIFSNLLEKDVIPLLVLNSPTLEHAVDVEPSEQPLVHFFDEDRAVLSNNYIPYWGKVWIAGKRLVVANEPVEFNISIPGDYQIQTIEPISISGRAFNEGDVVSLARGKHRVTAHQPTQITLSWAQAKPAPSSKPTEKPIYRGFRLSRPAS